MFGVVGEGAGSINWYYDHKKITKKVTRGNVEGEPSEVLE